MPHDTPQKKGAQTLVERTTPEWRRERARKAHLASAVNAVVNRVDELTEDQITKLRAAIA